MDDTQRLADIPWFARLAPAVREALIPRGRWRRKAAGEWLYGEGDEETGVVAIVDGALGLHAAAPGGREVMFSVLPAGGVIGQSRLFGGGPRLVTAICTEPSLLFLLPDQALRQTAAEHPALWEGLSRLVYAQLRAAIEALAQMAGLKPRERLIARLLSLTEAAPRVAASQAALAEMVGVTRKAVNGWLGELEASGRIARGYGWVEVKDRAGLERLLV